MRSPFVSIARYPLGTARIKRARSGGVKRPTCSPRKPSSTFRTLLQESSGDFRSGSHPEELRTSKTSPLRFPKADVERTSCIGSFGPILLQNSLMVSANGDSVALMRIGGAGHDGAE